MALLQLSVADRDHLTTILDAGGEADYDAVRMPRRKNQFAATIRFLSRYLMVAVDGRTVRITARGVLAAVTGEYDTAWPSGGGDVAEMRAAVVSALGRRTRAAAAVFARG